jgi:hypothetical protein
MRDTFEATRELHSPAVIRALSSMRSAEVDLIIDAVADFGDRWIMHTHDDYNGYLFVLIEPTGSDQARPSYLVSGTAGRIELDQVQDDELSALGAFKSVPAAAARLVSLLCN